jgi:hypothetical protein
VLTSEEGHSYRQFHTKKSIMGDLGAVPDPSDF